MFIIDIIALGGDRMAEKQKKTPKRLIFRAWKRLKDGTIIFAKDYGKRAFPIWIPISK